MERPAVGLVATILVVLAVTSGCAKATGSKSSTPGRPSACSYVAKLDSIAATVAEADVRDPDTFNAVFQTAVHDYAANVAELRAVAPGDLSSSLALVEADVQQLRFDAALTDRAPLDAYAARTCGRVATTATSVSPTTTAIPPPVTSTTVPTGPTTTSLP